jgi:hypothetical protein
MWDCADVPHSGVVCETLRSPWAHDKNVWYRPSSDLRVPVSRAHAVGSVQSRRRIGRRQKRQEVWVLVATAEPQKSS